MNINTNIFIDFNDEIAIDMASMDFIEYIQWYFDETDDTVLIKLVKQLLVDFDKLDVLLYDMDLNYRDFMMNICRIYPNILTPHIIKQIKNYIEDNGLNDE